MQKRLPYLLPMGILSASTAWAQTEEVEAITDIGKLAKNLVMTFVWIILAIGMLAVVFFIVKRVMYNISISKVKSTTEQVRDEIDGHLQKGNHAAAAAIYERMGEPEQAAKLYIQGNKHAKAAAIYEDLQRYEKAIDLYIKAGESLKAAQLHIKLKNYFEAAKIFKNKGDRIRAAQALEMYGNKLGAAKEYKEAGQYLKAAKLYKDLNLYPETTEMFRLLLEDKEVDDSNVGQFYMFATFLTLTEQNKEALDVFKKVHAYDPGFRDVAQRLELLSPSEATPQPEAPAIEEKEEVGAPVTDVTQIYAAATADMEEEVDDIESLIEQELAKRDGTPTPATEGAPTMEAEAPQPAKDTSALQHETTLKNMIRSGTLEPRYAMKLWVEVLRTLKSMHDRSQYIGVLSPHTIFIDMENNIRIEPPTTPPPAYLSPEFREGASADAQTDIYSAGVLLYEMTTGSLEDFGMKNPSQLSAEVPEWMDEIVLRCTENERANRYQNLDDIYSRLLELRDKM